MSEFEEFIKAKYPVDYESLKEKYPKVPVVEFYGDELDVWNYKQSEIDQLKAEKAGLEKSVKQILSDSKESMVGYVEMDLYDKGYRVCTEYLIDELEKALRGEHE